MKNNLKCPMCGHEFKSEPFKTWKYALYEVKRFECPHCLKKFNVYENPKTVFTIPKGKKNRIIKKR
jgi:transposase-like protein